MDRSLAFRRFPGRTPLHRWDARCKLGAVLVVSVAVLRMPITGLALFSLLYAVAVFSSRLPAGWLPAVVRNWTPILIIIFVINALDFAGPRIEAARWLPVSEPSLLRAVIACWRLALLLAFASLFSAITDPRALRDGITWLLAPLPFIPARRVGFMVALAMRFLPLLLDELAEVRQALRARLGDRTRNPLRRIRQIAFPLLRRAFLRADDLARAVVARGYREDLPLRLGPPRRTDCAALGVVAVLAVVATFFGGA